VGARHGRRRDDTLRHLLWALTRRAG
jgi:hypothetical protein